MDKMPLKQKGSLIIRPKKHNQSAQNIMPRGIGLKLGFLFEQIINVSWAIFNFPKQKLN
jgi:hypothetical protein